MNTRCTPAYLFCRILESKSADFIEHPVVEKEVDSTAGSWFQSWHILDAKAVLEVYVITPKHIINYRYPLTCARIQELQFTLNVAMYSRRWLVKNEEGDWFQMSSGFLTATCQRSLIHPSSTYLFTYECPTKHSHVMASAAIILPTHSHLNTEHLEGGLLWPWPGLKSVHMFPSWQAVRDGTAAWGEVSGSLFGGGGWADQTSTW